MELMDKSLHQLYQLVYKKLHLTIPEPVIGKMALSVSCHMTISQSDCCNTLCLQVVKALHFLKFNLKVMHRGRCWLVCVLYLTTHTHTHTLNTSSRLHKPSPQT